MADLGSLTTLLDAAESAAPVDAVSALTREIGHRLGATQVSLLVADTSGRALVRLGRTGTAQTEVPRGPQRTEGDEAAVLVVYDGGPLEQVVRRQRVELVPPDPHGDGTWTVLAPVSERGEVVGVLELRIPHEPTTSDRTEIAALAHLLAFVVLANRRHTDLFEWGQRSRPLSLSAEIQQRLLPGPRTCEAGAFTLSGWLEPAADIAGDTFDYSLARNELHLSMTDAMGHGVAAALTATLCVSALRGSRRRGASLVDQTREANAAVTEHGARSGLDDFVTGLVARIDLRSGVISLVNAGHVPPYLSRGGEVTEITLPHNVPIGMFADASYDVTDVQLLPGDRLVIVTDGMLERNAAAIDLPAAIRDSAALHPREATASLADSVLAATGQVLTDDATVLCLDWYGGHGRDRTTTSGVDTGRASAGR